MTSFNDSGLFRHVVHDQFSNGRVGAQTSVAETVVDLERRGWEALLGKDGAKFYADLMAEDGLMIFPGMVLTKEQSLAAIRQAAPWLNVRLEDVRVLSAGETARSSSTGRSRIARAAQTYEAMMTSVSPSSANLEADPPPAESQHLRRRTRKHQ